MEDDPTSLSFLLTSSNHQLSEKTNIDSKYMAFSFSVTQFPLCKSLSCNILHLVLAKLGRRGRKIFEAPKCFQNNIYTQKICSIQFKFRAESHAGP